MKSSHGAERLRRYGLARHLFNAVLAAFLTLGAAMPGGAAPPDGVEPARILVLGDSLSAGYRLPADASFTAQLEAALRAGGHEVTVPNTGVSGETTAGGLARLDWMLGDRPDLAIVALGGNDGLRGIDPAATRDNLDRILTRLKERGVPAVLAGMKAPRNLGRTYAEAFDALYPELAAKHGVPFYPFLLDGVALDPDLNLDDGLHPNAKGVAVMVAGILPVVTRALDGIGGTGTKAAE